MMIVNERWGKEGGWKVEGGRHCIRDQSLKSGGREECVEKDEAAGGVLHHWPSLMPDLNTFKPPFFNLE